MLSINMRVFKALLIAALLYDATECSPVKQKQPIKGSTTTKAPIESNSLSSVKLSGTESLANTESTIVELSKGPESNVTIDYYDQRQNGTENFRVHVDGFALVVAPVEALLLGQAIGGDALKPTTQNPTAGDNPMMMPKMRGGSHVANVFLPWLRRFRQT